MRCGHITRKEKDSASLILASQLPLAIFKCWVHCVEKTDIDVQIYSNRVTQIAYRHGAQCVHKRKSVSL